MTTIYQTVRDVLAETGIDIDEHPDEGWAAADGLDGDGSWLLVGQADEEERTLTVYSVPAIPPRTWSYSRPTIGRGVVTVVPEALRLHLAL